ncbi:hypothetical protein ACHAWU_007518 [Discostella pseudostelligera]|uniref:Pyrroline-5-carboxylate reductase catalytic N-terminal domain-containing protein n=1 Tax=Discostella pseudostelligera TaxID=259834 RepID=A0ABD3M6W4_9STRA
MHPSSLDQHTTRIDRRRPIIIITCFFILFIFIIGTAIPAVDAFCDSWRPKHINLHLQQPRTFGAKSSNPKLFIASHYQSLTKKMTLTSTEMKMSDIDNTNCIDSSTLTQIKAGFIGCGTIASSIATALATPPHSTHLAQHAGLSLHSISVTKRSESKSSKLKQSFPDIVTIYDSASDVVHNSNVVFLCVLPQQVEKVLDELKKANVWRKEEHTLVSLVATSNVEELILQSNLPRSRVYKMICLPSIAKREGCALLQRAPSSAPIALPSQSPTDDSRNNNSANDKNEQHTFIDNTDANNSLNEGNDNNNNIDIKAMLMALGGCVECRNDTIMNTMMITSCMMGPLYGVMRANRDWLVKNGVTPEDASYFVGRSYLSMVQDAERNCQDPKRFDDLIEEQTPGGLNEQSLRNLEKQKVFESYDRTMDAILSRLQGTSDGSLPS